MWTATIQTAAREEREAREPARADASVIVLSSAELAECTCPEWCERDHDREHEHDARGPQQVVEGRKRHLRRAVRSATQGSSLRIPSRIGSPLLLP